MSGERVRIADEDCVLCSLQDITERKRSETELLTAIEAVMADASWFSRGVIERLATLRRPPPSGQPVAQVGSLTAREREVIGLIGDGATDAEIGTTLGLAQNTVRNHVTAIYRKLGVNRRSAVVIWARERSLTVKAKKPPKSLKTSVKTPDSTG